MAGRTRAGGVSACHEGVTWLQRVAAGDLQFIEGCGIIIVCRCFGADPRAVHQPGFRAAALKILQHHWCQDVLHVTMYTAFF